MPAPMIFAACVEAAALFYGHRPDDLWRIRRVEGGVAGQEVVNRNGSADLGPFQVNDKVWVPHFAKAMGKDRATIRSALKNDACFNAYAAGYILRRAVDNAGGDIWEGMGRYHSGTPALKAAYQSRLAGLDRKNPQAERRRILQNERLSAAGVEEDLIRGHAPLR